VHGLRDVRGLDLSTGIAGGYATKLFADADADVVKVEPPDGDPLRRWSASGTDLGDDDGALFRFLNASKRSVVGAPDDPAVLALVADADLVVESFAPGVIDALDLLARVPSIVVLSLSPFGRGGPWDDRPATEFTVQAACGSLGFRGRPSQRPLQAGGRVAEWAAGAYGAPAALAAVNGARRTGRGTHIDVSQLEAMTIATNLFVDLMYSLFGRPAVSGPARNLELPSIEPTADGWVGFNTNAAQQFHDFCVMIERPDLLDDPEMSGIGGRSAHADEWTKIIHEWTTQHTTDEIVELASLLRIPVAPVCNGRTVLEHPQFVAREVFVADATRTFRHPRPPYLVNGERLPPTGRAPALGEHAGAMPWSNRRPEPI